jgi:hypothetical protein
MLSTRALLVTGGAAAAALTGVFVGHAVASGPSPAAPAGTAAAVAASTPAPTQPRPHRFGPTHRVGPRFGPFGSLGNVLYGQFVVRTPKGGYQTVDLQRGTVQSISPTSVVVLSANGHTGTYAVTSTTIVDAQRDGIGSIHRGDQVMVVATGSGSSPKATRIADLTLLRKGSPLTGPAFPAPPTNGSGPNI